MKYEKLENPIDYIKVVILLIIIISIIMYALSKYFIFSNDSTANIINNNTDNEKVRIVNDVSEITSNKSKYFEFNVLRNPFVKTAKKKIVKSEPEKQHKIHVNDLLYKYIMLGKVGDLVILNRSNQTFYLNESDSLDNFIIDKIYSDSVRVLINNDPKIIRMKNE